MKEGVLWWLLLHYNGLEKQLQLWFPCVTISSFSVVFCIEMGTCNIYESASCFLFLQMTFLTIEVLSLGFLLMRLLVCSFCVVGPLS